MNDRTKFHLQSVTFALLVLVLALISNSGDSAENAVIASASPSLTATALATVDSGQALSADVKAPANEGREPLDQTSEAVAEPSTQSFASAPLSVKAASALIIELGDGAPLLEYRSEYRWPLASLTKLMTALIAYDEIGPMQTITISAEAVESEGAAGGFSPGEVFSTQDLVQAMITVSSNDAATAISEYLGHSRLVDLMQQKAATLGMRDTTFIDATGLSFLNQSTVGDIERLVTYVYHRYPEILAFAQPVSSSITEIRTGTKRLLGNVNQFAGNADFLGGKTGTTDESKQNLVSIFRHQGGEFIIIVLGSEDRFGETTKLYNWLKAQ
ncbi:MAG: serine hydrolase [Anaerolineales bacterium]|nr:serine hydrolase [Anaerolineales bacterium]